MLHPLDRARDPAGTVCRNLHAQVVKTGEQHNEMLEMKFRHVLPTIHFLRDLAPDLTCQRNRPFEGLWSQSETLQPETGFLRFGCFRKKRKITRSAGDLPCAHTKAGGIVCNHPVHKISGIQHLRLRSGWYQKYKSGRDLRGAIPHEDFAAPGQD